ncbi:DUF262 domain-containing protein [Intestinibacter bartlettii]|uniref:DUF262 domain-containing protein n=1 Tax=Intestinibacter bartlettii TaxID=261299 RepID=UPI0022E7F6B8|nr:DUF262 domain-containing protein [Intestinibacter bartlettii]
MYEIRPESVKTFITDKNMRLPRFQRKQTWGEEKNFQLCISLFKEYPIGVSILSIEKIEGEKNVKWLLDGRQRKNALSLIYEDPEKIYFWARKFIGFKDKDKTEELEEKYWKKISEYIESDSEEIKNENNNESENEEFEQNNNDSQIGDYYCSGLKLLLEIIKVIHAGYKNSTGFTRPFDIRDSVKNLPYVENRKGDMVLSSKKLKTFLDEYNNYCNNASIDYEKYESFIEFVQSRCVVINEDKLNENVKSNWRYMFNRIVMIEKIDELLSNSRIGIIEVKDLSPADSQKVFNIINTEGEKLTAVEVLSAKPNWNKKIDNPSDESKQVVKQLYERMGINKIDDVVRWDLPATLIRRLNKNIIIGKSENSSKFNNKKTEKKQFENEITSGFKILAGIYQNGVKKEDIEALSKNKNIDWESDIDKLIQELNTMISIIESSTYFKYLKSWNTPIFNFTSNFIVMNFIIILYKDWKRKGKPSGNDIKTKQFQKNSMILLDRLLYEYVKGIWKASSDSKIANNIQQLDSESEVFEPIDSNEWEIVLNEIFEKNTINGSKITVQKMKPLLFHFYALNQIQGPGNMYKIDIDHIIPVSLFNKSAIENKDSIKDNILNLGLLPKDDNIYKSNKRLSEIKHNQWLVDQVKKYEFIERDDFNKYSNINNYEEMFKFRKEIFKEAFTTKRENILNN